MRARLSMATAIAALAGVQLVVAGHPGVARADTDQTVLVSADEGLYAYEVDTGDLTLLIQTLHSQTPSNPSEWVNGAACFLPGDSAHRFLIADDNPDDRPPSDPVGSGFDGDAQPFFGLFDNDATRDFNTAFGDHGRIGAAANMNDPAGCAFDAAGNFFGVDVGDVHAPFVGDGQLIKFFAPDFKTWCVIDDALSQPGMVAFDSEDGLLVPQAGFGQIVRYSGFPASASSCGGTSKEIWMESAAQGIGTPIGITRLPGNDGWAVSSVLVPPAIFRVTDDGIVDGVLAAPDTEVATPFGLGFDSGGNLYFADLGVRPFPLQGGDPFDPITAAEDQGAFRVVPAGGPPLAEPIATGWQFPDGVTVVPSSWIVLP